MSHVRTHLSHWFLISLHKGHYKVKLYMQICFRPLMLPFSSSVLQCCSCVNCQRGSFIPSCVGESGAASCIPQCHRAHEVSGWSDIIDHSLFDMYHTVWPCTTLYGHVPHCMAMYHTVWPCTTLYGHVPHCMVMYHTVWACTTLYGHVPHCLGCHMLVM